MIEVTSRIPAAPISVARSGQVLSAAPRGSTRRPWILLLLCLITPIACSIARKLSPGQPAAFETAAAGVVLFVFAWVKLRYNPRLPARLFEPIAIVVSIHLLYLMVAMTQDWRIGVTSICTRLVPMTMMLVAAGCVRRFDDFNNVVKLLGIIFLLQIPAAVAMIFAGNSALPSVFQAIDSLRETRLDQRLEFDAFCGFFSTPAGLSTAGMSVVFLLLAVGVSLNKSAQKLTVTIAALMATLCVYLTVRRGMFFLTATGVIVYLAAFSRRLIHKVLLVFIVLASFYATRWIDSKSMNDIGDSVRSDTVVSDLEIQDRFGVVFIPIVGYWVNQYPLVGSFLGNGGLEGSSFGVQRDEAVEVLAAVWVVEFGAVLAALCAIAMGVFIWRVYQLAREVVSPATARLLALYCFGFFGLSFFKEASAFCQITLANLIFWSVPGILIGLSNRTVTRVRRSGSTFSA